MNDVGQGTWEEINDATTGGKNFGWPTAEGTSTNAAFTNPIYKYPHSGGDVNGCAITGGTFFNPVVTNYPSEYVGQYFFQDLCSHWISSITLSGTVTRTTFGTNVAGSGVAIATGNDGNLYFLSRSNGALYKIIYNKTTLPFITTQPVTATIPVGQSITFSVKALGSTPFTYQWQKNGVDISGAKSATYTITNAIEANSGKYRVVVSNSAGNTPSNEATLTVIANKIPVATITTPVGGTTYVAGTTLNFSGIGDDPEDGLLPAGAFSWSIHFHHDIHMHDQPDVTGVKSGSFEIPNEGETSANVWYRIILTVTDSKGLKGKDSVDIYPRKTTLAFETTPPGLDITLDGQPLTTPSSVESVEGILRTIGVPSPQTVDHVIYSFASWSNHGTQSQTFTTPTDDVTLNATFTFVVGTEHQTFPVQEVSVYPNPSSVGYVNVCLPSVVAQRVNIRLVDMLAREVSAQEQTVDDTGCFLLSYGKLKKGVYALHLDQGGKIFVQRVVVAD